ncbi:unnamed protein product [Pylaiella littoralis]
MQVFCRIRPAVTDDIPRDHEKKGSGTMRSEVGDSCIEAWTSNGKITYFQGTRREFHVTGCYGADSSQEEVFNGAVAGVVDGIVNGYNGTLLCIGRRGSGKSYTMIGSGPTWRAQKGVLARSMTRLFSGLKKLQGSHVRVRISYLGIYCETLQDLLDPSAGRDIIIREKSNGETFVEGLSFRTARSSVEAISIFERAQVDDSSSRSHAIAIVYVVQRCKEGASSTGEDLQTQQSCLMLADLAASESSKRTDARYQRLEECKFTNLSMSALGNCVAALAKRQAHIPYRDSKLTRLLQQSLGGNSRTALIVGLLPQRDELGETLATLVFAQRAMSVTMDAHITVVPDLDARCQDLQRQLDNQSDRLTQMTLKKAAAEEGLELARDQLAQLFEEKNSTNARLQTVVEAYDRILKVLLAAGTCRTFTSQYPRFIAQSTYVRPTSASMSRDSLKEGFEARVKAYKTAAASAATKCSSSEIELTKEREAHLLVARGLRVCKSEARKQEREANHRVSELLNELNERDAVIEEREARIRVLENQVKEHRVALGKEYVSRHQVEEMEALFETAVEGLSNRLRDMETRNAENHGQHLLLRCHQDNGIARNLNCIRAPGRKRSPAGAATFC